jgi:hypothetical protein
MRTRLPSILIQLVLAICMLSATELGWRVFALTKFLEFQAQTAPPSAESVSKRVAPLLTSRDAEKVYATVQSQHVELSQQYELTQALARSARETTLIAFCASLVAILLTGVVLWLIRPSRLVAAQN